MLMDLQAGSDRHVAQEEGGMPAAAHLELLACGCQERLHILPTWFQLSPCLCGLHGSQKRLHSRCRFASEKRRNCLANSRKRST